MDVRRRSVPKPRLSSRAARGKANARWPSPCRMPAPRAIRGLGQPPRRGIKRRARRFEAGRGVGFVRRAMGRESDDRPEIGRHHERREGEGERGFEAGREPIELRRMTSPEDTTGTSTQGQHGEAASTPASSEQGSASSPPSHWLQASSGEPTLKWPSIPKQRMRPRSGATPAERHDTRHNHVAGVRMTRSVIVRGNRNRRRESVNRGPRASPHSTRNPRIDESNFWDSENNISL